MIATVAFDADETLLNTYAGVAAGLEGVVAALGHAGVTVELLQADAAHFWRTIPELPAQEIRTTATRHTLRRFGLEHELERIMEIFFGLRFSRTLPFPGVVELLEQLRPHYKLGYATNGNSEADRCGLAGQFSFELYALRGGLPKKPAERFFEAVTAAAGCLPAEVVYVGDTYEHDVVGPAAFGMRTVWFNRKGVPVPGATQPDAVIENLSELPRILAGWR